MKQPTGKVHDDFRAAVTLTVVLVAGVTLVVIFGSLLAGLWLDKILDSKPWFTISLILLAIPVTLVLTFRIVKMATGKIQPGKKNEFPEEEPHRGDDN